MLSPLHGQLMPLTARRTVAAGAAYTPPYDSVSPSALFGLRKLRTAYSGPVVKVRRASDNAESDFGLSGNDFDSAACSAFVPTGDGFVTTFYDHSGNGRDFTQTDPVKQPKIVFNGALSTDILGNVFMRFDGTNSFLTRSAVGGALISAAACTIFCLFNPNGIDTNAGDSVVYDNDALVADVGYWGLHLATSANRLQSYHYVAGVKTSTVSIAVPGRQMALNRHGSGTLYNYVNGGAGSSVACGNLDSGFSTGDVYFGRNYATARYLGYIGEISFFNTSLSAAECNAIGNDLATRYGLTWNSIS